MKSDQNYLFLIGAGEGGGFGKGGEKCLQAEALHAKFQPKAKFNS